MTETADVLFRQEGAAGRITLNRPQALNALTLDMCLAIRERLRAWAALSRMRAVVVDATPGRAFCAGGDMRAIWQWARAEDPHAREFFAVEYTMNATIAGLPMPYVAVMDGIVMGGGAGISVYGSHRVATENTVFAMPETAIGFFPDVGGSYFLSRLPGALGMYLGLTGARLKAADLLYAGLATHFVPSARSGEIAAEIGRGRAADAILAEIAESAGDAPLAARRAAIDRTFSAPTVEGILAGLRQEGPWGAETATLLESRSPTSLKLVRRQLEEGKRRDLKSCLRMEYALAARILATHDFREGVRAVLIDKDQRPHWRPAALAEVSEDTVDRFFASDLKLDL